MKKFSLNQDQDKFCELLDSCIACSLYTNDKYYYQVREVEKDNRFVAKQEGGESQTQAK